MCKANKLYAQRVHFEDWTKAAITIKSLLKALYVHNKEGIVSWGYRMCGIGACIVYLEVLIKRIWFNSVK